MNKLFDFFGKYNNLITYISLVLILFLLLTNSWIELFVGIVSLVILGIARYLKGFEDGYKFEAKQTCDCCKD